MKIKSWLCIGTLLGAAACGGSDDDDNTAVTPDGSMNPELKVVEVNDDITAATTWQADTTYVLKKHIFVRGGVLTIEPGTVIKGDAATSLVVTTDGKIDAVGTIDKPIIFTSSQPVGVRAAGDWGGVVLLGKAPINVAGGSEAIEGFPAGTTGTQYGGDDVTHNCGTFKYARIEFAGFELEPDNELNSLTLGACGNKTVVDYVQTHRGADDGIEIFGGTVKITHVVLSQTDDDSLDWDFGWQGGAQFLIAQQTALTGNMGFEADNNKSDNDAEPRSNPKIWNATLVGSDAEPGEAGKEQGGMHLRRGTAGEISNTIIAYFADFAVNVSDMSTVAQAQDGKLVLRSSYFFQNANDVGDGWPTDFDMTDGIEDDCAESQANCFSENGYFASSPLKNQFVDPMLEAAATSATAPVFAPQTGSPVLTTGLVPPDGFDASATYVGAIGTVDWTTGWTAYPSN